MGFVLNGDVISSQRCPLAANSKSVKDSLKLSVETLVKFAIGYVISDLDTPRGRFCKTLRQKCKIFSFRSSESIGDVTSVLPRSYMPLPHCRKSYASDELLQKPQILSNKDFNFIWCYRRRITHLNPQMSSMVSGLYQRWKLLYRPTTAF